MHWKTIHGREYLYRAYSYGKNRSLGVRSLETEQIKYKFEHRQADYKAREAEYRNQFKKYAAYIKANALNRFPLAGARVLRSMHKQKIPYRLIGTNALYAFEARAGVLIQPEHLATEDMDFITQGVGSPMQRSAFDELLETDDLHPVVIDSLKWHVSAPHYDAIVFDLQGMPLRVATVDPRAFVLHKWFVSQQPDREPIKRIRDEDQARLVATMIQNELTDLPVSRAISRIFPHIIQTAATDALDDFSL